MAADTSPHDACREVPDDDPRDFGCPDAPERTIPATPEARSRIQDPEFHFCALRRLSVLRRSSHHAYRHDPQTRFGAGSADCQSRRAQLRLTEAVSSVE